MVCILIDHSSRPLQNKRYYSFKIFLHFWLAKSTRIIHNNQLLLTKSGRNLPYWTDDVKSAAKLQIIELVTEKSWGRGWVVLVVRTKMADNTILDLHNSSDDTQPHSIIVKYYSVIGLFMDLVLNDVISQTNKQTNKKTNASNPKTKRVKCMISKSVFLFSIKCASLRYETE